MFDPYNQYNPYSPYYGYNQQVSQVQRPQSQPVQYRQQTVSGLQGKIVDSLDVVKAAEIPYDR